MQRVSTNLTLFFKFFIPVFYTVLMGAITTAAWLSESTYFRDASMNSLRWGLTFALITGVAVYALTLLPLMRVEMNEQFIYASNYFKAARYPWHNVEQIRESRFLILTLVTIQLKVPGQFGKRLRFLASNRLFRDFKEQHVPLFEAIK